MRFLICMLLAITSMLSAKFADTYIFYVATDGNDANPGTQEAPFLTLQRAQAAVRSLPSSAFSHQDVYVLLRGGIYRVQQTLELTPADSGREGHDVVYAAYPGETPVLNGAIQVTGWTLYDPTLGIYRAHVGNVNSRQLFVNGTLAQRARTTSYPAGFRPAWANGGIEFIVTTLNPTAWNDPSTWTNQTDIEAVILTQWKMMRVPLQSVIASDPSTGTGLLVMQEPAWNNSNVYFDVATGAPGVWSFWQVTWFENAYQFLTQPGQWYLDTAGGYLYYIPLAGQDISSADVELPLLEQFVQGQGTSHHPIHNIRFEGLTFNYATWLAPSSSNGYVSDQSAMLLLGPDHEPNVIGHDKHVVPSMGILQFIYAQNIAFSKNIFQNLGGVALQFWTGSQNNTIESNLFRNISSSAIELGGVSSADYHPNSAQLTKNNVISNNMINTIGTDYNDAAGIFVGFTKSTIISHNTIINVPWSGIAMGWGWGLLDKGSFPGVGGAVSGLWGEMDQLTPNKDCKIVSNWIENFLGVLWDAGAVYTTGRQGPTVSEGLLIKENVATGKRPAGGGNVFYNDGGTRCVHLDKNVSYNNPIGVSDYGPPPNPLDPLPYNPNPSKLNGVPYGSDHGGCRTYGDLKITGNWWYESPMPSNIVLYNYLLNLAAGFTPYIYDGFCDPCPYKHKGVSYPTELSYHHNHFGFFPKEMPSDILSNAGVKNRPSNIPQSLWNP